LTLIASLPDILAGTEKAIRLKNIEEGNPDKEISIMLEDKATALNATTQAGAVSLGSMVGGFVYDMVGKDPSNAAFFFALIAGFVLFSFFISTFVIFRDQNIKDYDTLDGTSMSAKSMSRSIKKTSS